MRTDHLTRDLAQLRPLGKMYGTVPDAAVLYQEPEYNREEFTCAGCMMFLADTSECAILAPSGVSPRGGCGLYVAGEATTSRAHPPTRAVSAAVAGYEQGPFTCKRCAYFEHPMRRARGRCAFGVVGVGGMVHGDGCCDAWKAGA